MQEFAISKNIQLGDEKGLKFPSVWDWSLQFTVRDRALFHNPLYVGRSAPCVRHSSARSFKRTKVTPPVWTRARGVSSRPGRV